MKANLGAVCLPFLEPCDCGTEGSAGGAKKSLHSGEICKLEIASSR